MSLPATELWTKFQNAIRFARTTVASAVAVIQAAPAIPAAERLLLNAIVATGAAPALASDGTNIEGFRTVNLYAFSSGGALTVTARVWLYTGFRWVGLTDLALTEASGALDALDTEGYQRIALQVTAYTGPGALSVGIFPYNVDV